MEKVVVVLMLLAMFIVSCDSPASTGNVVEAERSTYRVEVEVESDGTLYTEKTDDSTTTESRYYTCATAYIYDGDENFVNDAEIKIDGILLVKQASDFYYSKLAKMWDAGSEHSYSISTPDGYKAEGTITKPLGKLSGIVYTPTKDVVTDSYTLASPTGGWPRGSYIICKHKENDRNYRSYNEVSQPHATITYTFDKNETDVEFVSMLMVKTPLTTYADESFISIIGDGTPW